MSVNGPVMLVATTVLRKQETRVGQLAGNLTLPRTVKLKTLLWAVAGLFPGLLLGTIIGGSITSIIYGGFFGAAIAVFLVTFEPMPGESLFTYLFLNARAKKKTDYVQGRPVSLAVGIAPLPTIVRGKVLAYPSAVNVQPGQYDERGVLDPFARSVTGLAPDPSTWTRTSDAEDTLPPSAHIATTDNDPFAPAWGASALAASRPDASAAAPTQDSAPRNTPDPIPPTSQDTTQPPTGWNAASTPQPGQL